MRISTRFGKSTAGEHRTSAGPALLTGNQSSNQSINQRAQRCGFIVVPRITVHDDDEVKIGTVKTAMSGVA